jgi:hypothetical protein
MIVIFIVINMKILRFSFVLLFLLILLTPAAGVNATSITDFKSLTWSEEIEKDATYSWKVNTLSFEGTTVKNADRYGFIEGAVIQIKVLVQLSDIDLMDFLNDTIEIPDTRDYVEISVNGVVIDFNLYNAIVFILPSEVTITEGETNAFYVLQSSEIVVFSTESKINPVSAEYTEFDDSENSEEFTWDINNGLLKRVNINYTDGFQFDLSLVTDESALDELPLSSFWIIGGAMIALTIIKKRK